jgi:hypothetical protein
VRRECNRQEFQKIIRSLTRRTTKKHLSVRVQLLSVNYQQKTEVFPMAATATLPTLKPDDFKTDQEVRWCPGCGDYSILAQMKKALASIGIPREKTAFVSRTPTFKFGSSQGMATAYRSAAIT